MNIKIKLLPGGTVPTRGSREAAGYDIYVVEDTTLHPSERKSIPTGLCVKIPSGNWLDIRGRSSAFERRGIGVVLGTVDADYVGEVRVQLHNLTDHEIQIRKGERLAQFVPNGKNAGESVEWILTDELEETERNQGGFGSTGV